MVVDLSIVLEIRKMMEARGVQLCDVFLYVRGKVDNINKYWFRFTGGSRKKTNETYSGIAHQSIMVARNWQSGKNNDKKTCA